MLTRVSLVLDSFETRRGMTSILNKTLSLFRKFYFIIYGVQAFAGICMAGEGSGLSTAIYCCISLSALSTSCCLGAKQSCVPLAVLQQVKPGLLARWEMHQAEGPFALYPGNFKDPHGSSQ